MKPFLGLGIVLSFVLTACAGAAPNESPSDPSAHAASMYRASSTSTRASDGIGRSASPLVSTRAIHSSPTTLLTSPRRR